MKQKRNYTGLLMLFMFFILMLVFACVFWITWNGYYRNMVMNPFYEKGSLLLTLVYIIIYFLFSKIYEGYKIGFLKSAEIIYSQSLSVIFSNIITYMQISLIAKQLVNPIGLFLMTLIEIFIVIIWTLVCNSLYFIIYPPINMVLIYSNESAASLISKIKGHKNKYNICEIINVNKGLEIIKNTINKYEAVIICDLDSTVRNKIVKYCYKKSISIYLSLRFQILLFKVLINFIYLIHRYYYVKIRV